jgi:hypothetical protein
MQLPALAVQGGDVTNGLLKAQQIAASQQGIESSQIRNKLLMQQQQDQQAARAQQGRINALASGAVGGDESALKRLMAVDPERAQQIVGLQGKLNEQQRAAAKAKAEFFGRGARILANTPQGKRQGVYASLRAGLIQRGVAGENELPPEYSADIDQNLQMLGLESDALNEMLDETRYEPLTDSGGNIVGQRNMKTGKVESDPRAPKAPLVKVETGSQRTVDEEMALLRAEKRAENMGKLDAATLEDYRELSASAEDQLPILRVMAELAPTLKTGALGETALNVQKTMERFGIPLDISGDTTKAELFQKLSNQMTLLQRKPGSGEMSDSDRDFFQNTVANLFTTPEGNALAIEFGMRRANRALEMEEQYSEWLRGGQEQPWATVRNKYLRENPLFTEADRAKAEAVSVRSGAAGAAQPGNAEKAKRLNSMGRDELMNIDPMEFEDAGLLRLYIERMKATR